ncbi:MAG: ABC transporter permease [Bacteroidales bacterium]|nr:ABC transporter permease [Bacteroidales bacterium]
MFDLDKWQEIFSTIRKNKLRTFLTGFSVAWGIFMLIILLGSGYGLENGVREQFKGGAVNGVWITSGMTSKAYKGLQPGREVKFTNEDYDLVKGSVDGIDLISSRFWINQDNTFAYKNNFGNFTISPVHPDYGKIKELEVIEGRFVNNFDLEKYRKVIVIGEIIKEALFKYPDTIAIGKYINVAGVPFQVIGVFHDEGSETEQRRAYVPIFTAQRVFSGDNRINQVSFTTNLGVEKSNAMLETITRQLAAFHSFDPADQRAISAWNKAEEFERTMKLFAAIRLFIWIIGIGTIIAGVVGVSNIMLIVVKERTKEIGIRKAIGASPRSVVSLILQESILITGFAGYIGLVAGVFLLEIVSKYMPPSDFFANPQADFQIAVSATILLVISGALAGLIPSLRAARIKPIVALRDE